MASDKGEMVKEFPLSESRLVTKGDKTSIGNNFYELVNLRYNAFGLEGVGGMSKINTTALSSYLKVRNAYHYVREQPSESHIVAQAWNSGETDSQIVENTTSVPSAGDFSGTVLYSEDSGVDIGRFTVAPKEELIYCNGTNNLLWLGDEAPVTIFVSKDSAYDGDFYYDYSEVINNTLTDSANLATIYEDTGDNKAYIIIGTLYPADGFKIYVSTANVNSGTMSVQYWNGSAWTSVSNLSDGTASGGVSLAQTGWVTFDSVASTSKPKIIRGVYIYWTVITIDPYGADLAVLSRVTASIPMQEIKDIWDGVDRTVLGCYFYDDTSGVYSDYTLNVYDEDYSSSNDATYMDVSSATTDDYIYVGFPERQAGLDVTIPNGKENSNAITISNIDYWDGGSWQNVSSLNDKTKTGSNTFANSGIISWSPVSWGSEFKKSLFSNEYPLYYYRIKFSGTLSANVYVDQITGIPAPMEIGKYRFPLLAHNRLWLCCEESYKKNSAKCSAYDTSVVFNGSDSLELTFGGPSELTAAAAIYTKYGSTIYDILTFFKKNETWVVVGSGSSTWIKYRVSGSRGCIAPLTLTHFHAEFELVPGLNRNVLIFQADDGIYLFDGTNFFPIHRDLILFDKKASSGDRLNPDMVGRSVGFLDKEYLEWHFLCATGTSTTLNEEWVYDFVRQRWYQMNRGTGKALQCGIEVNDTDGNEYTYGFIDTGYMERLENGTDFDGGGIAQSFGFGELGLGKTEFEGTQVRQVLLKMSAKTTTDQEVSVSYYADTCTTAKWTESLSQARSGYEVAKPKLTKGDGWYSTHGLHFSVTTDDETYGFEPMKVSVLYKSKGLIYH